MATDTGNPDVPADLRWQCRRGMLELDLILNNFIDNGLGSLVDDERATFERVLSYPDQTLYDLLLGNTVSADRKVAGLVQRIRSVPFA